MAAGMIPAGWQATAHAIWVVARRQKTTLRIMTFDEVIGQQEVKERLVGMVTEHKLPHALMFCGPTGSGKMALALAFASYLLGDSPMLRKWEHPDLLFAFPVVKPVGASSDTKVVCEDYAAEWRAMLSQGPYFTIDQWLTSMRVANQQAVIYEAESEALIRKLSLKSSQGGYKVVVIWLPERMNVICANKILKLLEEPPQQTVFLMVSEAPEKLLDTIRSRVQRIDIRRIDDGAIEQALTERRGIELSTAHRIAHFASGSWLRALEVLEADNENAQLLEMFKSLMRLAYMRDIKSLKRWSEDAASLGREKQKRMLTYFSRMIRENFMFNFATPELCYMTEGEEAFARNFARFVNERNVISIAEELEKSQREIGQNVTPKIVMFDLALNMIMMLKQ